MPNPNTEVLTANTVKTITVEGATGCVDVFNVSGTDTVWVSDSATNPTVGGDGFYPLPPGMRVCLDVPYENGGTTGTVKVISVGTNTITAFACPCGGCEERYEGSPTGSGGGGGGLTNTELRAAPVPVAERTFTTSGSVTNVADAVTLTVDGTSRAVSFWIGGTYSGANLTYEASPDGGTTWYSLLAHSAASGTLFNAGVTGVISGAPIHQSLLPPGANRVRARLTAITSGTVTLTITAGADPILPGVALIPNGTQVVDTELATAAALADAASNPTTTTVGAVQLAYNGASNDRFRNNTAPTAVDTSSARTASGTGTTYTNYNGRSVSFYVNVTAVSGTTPTCTFRIQETYDGTNWIDMDTTNLQTASITANGQYKLRVGAGIATVANASANLPAPRQLRLAWTIGGTTPSFTFASYAVSHV